VVLRLLLGVEREALHILSVFMPQISFYLLDVLERSVEVLDRECERSETVMEEVGKKGVGVVTV